MLVNEFWVPYDITVSATDENTIWAARTSQYNSYPNLNGKQVYKSIDGGVTWTNYGTAILDGEWELIRKNDNPKGSFTYIFKKIENNWLIISDYSTNEYYP